MEVECAGCRDSLKIFRPGSQVMLGTTGIVGTVRTVSLPSNGGIAYEIVWWCGADRKSDWFAEGELSSSEEKVQIGFRGNGVGG